MTTISIIKDSNIFNSKCQTLVNTINCVGVMGKGLALEMKNRFPTMFEKYKDLCNKQLIDVGKLWLYKDFNGTWILNFPTKKHWKLNSEYEYIEENAIDLNMRYIRGLSADMEDLLKDQGRKDAEMFFDYFLWSASKNIYVNTNQKERTSPILATLPEKAKMKSNQKDVVIITDNTNSDSNLAVMIKRFENIFSYTRILAAIENFS